MDGYNIAAAALAVHDVGVHLDGVDVDDCGIPVGFEPGVRL